MNFLWSSHCKGAPDEMGDFLVLNTAWAPGMLLLLLTKFEIKRQEHNLTKGQKRYFKIITVVVCLLAWESKHYNNRLNSYGHRRGGGDVHIMPLPHRPWQRVDGISSIALNCKYCCSKVNNRHSSNFESINFRTVFSICPRFNVIPEKKWSS